MIEPVRLQLSRRKGFDLQALSRATNGLDAVNCRRPALHSNPFSIAFCQSWFACGPAKARRKAIQLFRLWRAGKLDATWTRKVPPPIDDVRGKNLACVCGLDEPCHVDLLLKEANR